MTLLSTVYCTADEIGRKAGATGLLNWSDHDASGTSDTGVIDDAINEATETIDLYCRQRYDQAGLAASEIVSRWAVVLACYFLSINRGNPAPEAIEAEYQRIIANLEKIAAGLMSLPGVPMRSDSRPSMSNLRVERHHGQSKIRVKRNSSTDAASSLPIKHTSELADR